MDNNNSKDIEKLFKLVFNNIVIFKNIYQHVILYKKNEVVEFDSRKELLEYKERGYIERLVYRDTEMLVKYDLPIDGILKEVEFTSGELMLIQGNAIPYGVEILQYAWNTSNNMNSTQLSTLPSTIHTVKNVIFSNNSNNTCDIPPNITSITFLSCPNISGNNDNGNGFITIPNTIKHLSFQGLWNNEGVELCKGDIPDSVTSLSTSDYKINKELLPNTITVLELSCDDSYEEEGGDSEDISRYIPPSIEKLNLFYMGFLTPESNLALCTSIKTFEITFIDMSKTITPNSLPSSITDLKIFGMPYEALQDQDVIPNNVRNLELWLVYRPHLAGITILPNSVLSLKVNMFIQDKFPSSLTHLEITCDDQRPLEELTNMVSILPQSLTSIILPKFYEQFNHIIKLPSSIKTINYKNYNY